MRQLVDLNESRPVRMIYGNRRYDQMCVQDEITGYEKTLPDFKQHLVLETEEKGVKAQHIGFIDKDFWVRSLMKINAITGFFMSVVRL